MVLSSIDRDGPRRLLAFVLVTVTLLALSALGQQLDLMPSLAPNFHHLTSHGCQPRSPADDHCAPPAKAK